MAHIKVNLAFELYHLIFLAFTDKKIAFYQKYLLKFFLVF